MDGVAISAVEFASGERFVALRRALGVSTFGINAVRLEAGQRGRIHRHGRQEEVYLVLEGALTLCVEQKEFELGPMEAARVAPELRRQLVNYTSEPLIVLALGGAEPHHGRDGEAFGDWTDAVGASPQEVPLPDDVSPRA
ncbi:MAG: cupin domain-containing protein [Solirubrobacteraceae bacterium]